MFTDKQSFVTSFKDRFVALNGKSFKEGTEQEVYQTLATMVREQAIPKWINTRDKQEEKQSKQVIYFSLEFFVRSFPLQQLAQHGRARSRSGRSRGAWIRFL